MPIVKVSASGFFCPTSAVLSPAFQNSMINKPNIITFWRYKKIFLCAPIGEKYKIKYFALNTNFWPVIIMNYQNGLLHLCAEIVDSSGFFLTN